MRFIRTWTGMEPGLSLACLYLGVVVSDEAESDEAASVAVWRFDIGKKERLASKI